MKVGSLFAGIGGFDLAARWLGWETRWFSEIDPYASAVLAKHWPGVPNHGDITKIDFSTVEPVDLLCGGFPCQDISNAGKRAGIDGSRSGLWGEFARAIRELRPRYVVVENVAALLGRGLERVLGDLAESGYDAEWEVLSAADVGAPHQRERVWIVAHPRGRAAQLQRGPGKLAGTAGTTEGQAQERQRGWDAPRNRGEAVANTDKSGLEGRLGRGLQERPDERTTREGGASTRGDGWWSTEPDVGRVAHGIPARVDRLRGLGNAIVPQCAYVIFQAIQEAEERMRAA